ncbi:hypothetical protein FKW77_002169 [Venturia effusa]|uniref:Uncharacterized protein n=1 Tax=Venturia effusa TaxID=50376 RepID=A0A517LJS0_9PEZI|nr:hypothetical protein FKW77_002169 [Venturia effusa]
MRRLGVARDKEGFWFYVTGILDLHSGSREFEQVRVWIAGADQGRGHEQKSEGMLRLSTLNSSRLSYENKYRTGGHEAKMLFWHVAFALVLLYQGLSASITYIVRVREVQWGTLDMDHLTGIYAICGTVLELATLVMLLQPYDWNDNNQDIKAERSAMPDVDTSNAWVYEGFLALTIHGLLWVVLRLWVFFDFVHKAERAAWSLFIESFSSTGIVVIGLVVVFDLPMMIPTIWEVVWKPLRGGMVWLARRTGIGYYTSGRLFRLLLAAMSLLVSSMIWKHAGDELAAVHGGKTKSWNAAWKEPNPSADTVYGVLLSLWS